jgi:hypothetical protein
MFMQRIALGALATSSVALAGPILNGGFETGDFTDWSTDGGFGASVSAVVMTEFRRNAFGPGPDFWAPTEGEWFASLWSSGVDDSGAGFTHSEISQVFTAGVSERLSFDWFMDFGDAVDFSEARATATLSWAGGGPATLVHVFGPDLGDFGDDGWNTTSFDLLDGVEYTLTFRIQEELDDPAFESLFGIDNVRLGPANVIPLPAAAGMAAIGLAGVGLRRRRGL